MEEIEPSSRLGIGYGGVWAKFLRLESGMEEFEQSWRLGIGNGGDRAEFRLVESGMEEFETSSRLAIRNGGVRDKFKAWNRIWRSSRQVLTLEIGKGEV